MSIPNRTQFPNQVPVRRMRLPLAIGSEKKSTPGKSDIIGKSDGIWSPANNLNPPVFCEMLKFQATAIKGRERHCSGRTGTDERTV